jgi:death-on-curing protein
VRKRGKKKAKEDAEVLFIADFLKRSTRKSDKRYYTVTYHQLNQILKKYGFELTNQNQSYIDVVHVEFRQRYFGLFGPKVPQVNKLAQIAFPGWKRQVGKDTLKKVREATGLTAKWVDSRAFFQDADPLHALIDTYSEPLRRLANR